MLVQARAPQPSPELSRLTGSSVAASALPKQGKEVLVQIRKGGPFRYEKDGVVFGNRERLLPSQKRGYYREYTVPTPGLSHRGARRIVCGGLEPKLPDACFYTDDHYASFQLIAQ
ncbi:MAG: ribonuclease [Hydrogenophaga sp.]